MRDVPFQDEVSQHRVPEPQILSDVLGVWVSKREREEEG